MRQFKKQPTFKVRPTSQPRLSFFFFGLKKKNLQKTELTLSVSGYLLMGDPERCSQTE